jgi:structural maintenance of chromosome 1
VKQRRTDKFMAAFKHISEEIGKIYKALTMSKEFPHGGKAYLSLESNEVMTLT